MTNHVTTSALDMSFKVKPVTIAPNDTRIKLALVAVISPDIADELIKILAIVRDSQTANDEHYEQIKAFWESLRLSIIEASDKARRGGIFLVPDQTPEPDK